MLITIWLLSILLNIAFYFVVDLSLGATTFFGDLVYNVISQGVGILLMPVGVIAATLLYYDFRIRKEGFDLEMLQQAMHEDFNPDSDDQQPPINQDQGF